MTLAGYMFGQFSIGQYLELFARILVACVCGAAIGFERSKRYKEAGIRTHIIVCCAAALMMIISKYAFLDVLDTTGKAFGGLRTADPGRVAAQVVSGISFLGAGVIFKNNGSVSGLTTAAGLWATAGIGLAVGGGMYILGVFTTALIVIFQLLLHKFKIGAESMPLFQISFVVLSNQEFQDALAKQLDKWSIHLVDTKMTKLEEGKMQYDISLRASHTLSTQEILLFFNNREDVLSVSVITP